MALLFDRYVAVDWSASAAPKTGSDSVWIAVSGRAGPTALANPATRLSAAEHLDELIAGDDRVLVGVDVCLGYPAGAAGLFGLDGVPWSATWRAIAELSSDDDRNANNRFEVGATLNRMAGAGGGPFWGCPHDDLAPALGRTKPAVLPVAEFRCVEHRLRRGGRHPKSAWQLLGAGSVGGQTLTMLPLLFPRLGRFDVWPFTTGLRSPTESRVVIAEIWPSWFVREIPAGAVADAVQVLGTAAALRAADASGELGRWFEPDVDGSGRAGVEAEEGWILGVG